MILNVFKPPRTKVKHCPISKNLIFVLNSIRTSSTGCAKNSGKRTHPRFQSLVYNLRCVEIKSVNLLGEWTKSPLSSDKSPKPSHGHKSPAPNIMIASATSFGVATADVTGCSISKRSSSRPELWKARRRWAMIPPLAADLNWLVKWAALRKLIGKLQD